MGGEESEGAEGAEEIGKDRRQKIKEDAFSFLSFILSLTPDS